MKISREAQRTARKLFDASLVDGCVDQDKSLKIANVLLETKPRHAFQILKEFTRLSRLALAQHEATIESATPLEGAAEAAIIKALQAQDSNVTISTTVNPSLLGGTRIRLGSNVWDGSIVAKLEKLKNL